MSQGIKINDNVGKIVAEVNCKGYHWMFRFVGMIITDTKQIYEYDLSGLSENANLTSQQRLEKATLVGQIDESDYDEFLLRSTSFRNTNVKTYPGSNMDTTSYMIYDDNGKDWLLYAHGGSCCAIQDNLKLVTLDMIMRLDNIITQNKLQCSRVMGNVGEYLADDANYEKHMNYANSVIAKYLNYINHE
jgi:hypothetical protein